MIPSEAIGGHVKAIALKPDEAVRKSSREKKVSSILKSNRSLLEAEYKIRLSEASMASGNSSATSPRSSTPVALRPPTRPSGKREAQSAESATNGEATSAVPAKAAAAAAATNGGAPAAATNGGAQAAARRSSSSTTPNGMRPQRDRRESTWLKEQQRCKYPKALIDFLNAYSQMPRAHWSNEIVRVDRASAVPFFEQSAVPFIECSVCFIIAENDEMENCNKEAQLFAFSRMRAAKQPKTFVEVPCGVGGHAGMMDSCGMIGHQQTWQKMIDATANYLRNVFDELW